MRLSRFFLPTLKENPAEAQIISHRLMLRAGMIRQHAAGIYNWLPMGTRVLQNIAQIVRDEQNAAGAQEIIMPTIQSGELWKESGRYDDYGPEMLRIKDRHDRDMLYGPTHEEVVTDIFRNNVKSYRDLPMNLYQIHWKFRDEVRPRFGVMRGREFLMKDAYSFDTDFARSKHSYNQMFVAYLRTFARMGLKAIPMKADSGPIGGDMSHEFIVLAETGESAVFCHKGLLEKPAPENVSYEGDLQSIVDDWTSLYAATEEKHDAAIAAQLGSDLVSARGIEVGHIFHFGAKYSDAMKATVAGPDGTSITPMMGSYGIGVSRLAGAIIEASHDDAGIIWPDAVAPYCVGLINLKTGDAACDAECEDLYAKLNTAGVSVLYDDRDERPGVKFANMDLIGLPWHVVIGPKGLAKGQIELKRRATGVREELSIDAVLQKLTT
ncbi:MAG: proline--tRNA ligase [Alphaproteobacteria bacterium]|nr:proline--tRNA ligase [Alphaproteobacteria bacterium]PHY00131.1 MAG: proline--tRNA ligase [Rhodospirillaceae bacterium]